MKALSILNHHHHRWPFYGPLTPYDVLPTTPDNQCNYYLSLYNEAPEV